MEEKINRKNFEEELKKANVKMVDIERLKGHEQTREERLHELKKNIMDYGLDQPIVVDEKTNVIIDGHHRTEIFKKLNLTHMPVLYVDYFDKSLVISDDNITKEQVIAKAALGLLYPSKTTKHMRITDNGLVHISEFNPHINLSFEHLKNFFGK
jgi:L-serine kinase (ADP)